MFRGLKNCLDLFIMRCLVTGSNKFFNEMNEVRIFFHGVRKKISSL